MKSTDRRSRKPGLVAEPDKCQGFSRRLSRRLQKKEVGYSPKQGNHTVLCQGICGSDHLCHTLLETR